MFCRDEDVALVSAVLLDVGKLSCEFTTVTSYINGSDTSSQQGGRKRDVVKEPLCGDGVLV